MPPPTRLYRKLALRQKRAAAEQNNAVVGTVATPATSIRDACQHQNNDVVTTTTTPNDSLANVVAATTIPANAQPAGVDLAYQKAYAPLDYWVGCSRFDINWLQAQMGVADDERKALRAENQALRAEMDAFKAESKAAIALAQERSTLAQERSILAEQRSNLAQERGRIAEEKAIIEIEWLKVKLATQADESARLRAQVDALQKAKDKKRSKNSIWRANKRARMQYEANPQGNDVDIEMEGNGEDVEDDMVEYLR